MTNNLNAPQVADNQDQKETTINDQYGRIDAAMTDALTCAIGPGNSFGVSDDDFQSHVQFDLTGGGVTADFPLSFDPGIRRGLFVVTNGSGFTASVGTSGQGSPPTLADGDMGLFFCDGVIVRKVA